MRRMIAGLLVVSSAGWLAVASAGPADEVPAPFLPFEHMIGGWKGTAKPTANPLKGWQESHGWAWKFEKGKPVGLSVTFEGDKTLSKGLIRYDEPAKKYHLDGTDPQGKPVTFLGAFSEDGKTLTFDRVGATPEGKERLVLRPNSNKIRYTIQFDRQEAGAPQYKSVFSVGLTKDGESFAAGAAGSDLPKCILTGGAAGITVSYQGKSYPVCCTGCRDEFNDNPEKYSKLADLAAAKAGKSEEKTATKDKVETPVEGSKVTKSEMPAKAKTEDAPPADSKTAKSRSDSDTKAARELQLGQNFEKGGKTTLALEHYRKVVKDFPTTEAAKTASARIKALGGK